MKNLRVIFIMILSSALFYAGNAQQFGRNKVVYENFNFRVFQTPHFDIHHYLEDEEEIRKFAQLTERWYERHLPIFLDTIETRIPIILYNNHADFQQTTVLQDIVGVGVGGVTEGLMKRVIMPLAPSRQQTNHVLGHELTHVHHFRILLGNGDRGLGQRAMQNVPLWLTEGQSEYLSIGRQDPHTALWMRDAVKHDNIPTLRDMTTRPDLYFPYRWGHAFWAFYAGHYGDGMVLPLYLATAQMGLQRAVDTLTGYSTDSLSVLWANELRQAFEPLIAGRDSSAGERLFYSDNAGEMNIAPAICPTGENIVFISDRNVISIDFFLADVQRGRITRQISNILREGHIDEYNYLESAGTWSPDGNRFALSVFSQGQNRLLVADLARERTRTRTIPGVNAFLNPVWSPQGDLIAVSGLMEGKSDIYVYNLETGEVEQLTDDRFAALQPSWSPDGSRIAFITDREGNTDFDILRFGNYRLAEYDINTGEINVIDILPGGDIFNPKYSPDGNSIFFVSNAEGFRDIYRYDITGGEVTRVTNLQTGVSGITELSPAFDIARESQDLVYILYDNTRYEIYRLNIGDLDGPVVGEADVNLAAAMLPPLEEPPVVIVEEELERYPLTDPERFSITDYDPRFGLEFIGSAGIGVGVGQFGTGMGGGVSFMFSDLLRENILSTALQVQGRLIDAAGQAVYINQARRLHWGGFISHFPYRSAGATMTTDEVDGTPVQNLIIMEQRIFENELGMFGRYPFSRYLRLEGGLSANRYSFRVDSINNYFVGNRLIDRERARADSPDGFYLFRTYAAYVGDRSRFGFTSPLDGYRYRFQVDRTFGEFSFWGLTADYRQYYFTHPFSMGFRLMHYGRYGPDAGRLQPVYVGNPFFVRGYNIRALTRPEQNGDQFININNLVGSKIAVANVELRLPFTGPEQLAIISSRMFFSDFILFADGGLAWDDFDDILLEWNPSMIEERHIPVFSTGVALRVNLFGAIIVEPYFALPFQRRADRTTGTFGFHLSFGGF